jgi:hypothetical protein
MYYHIDMGKIKIKGTVDVKYLVILLSVMTAFILLSGIMYVYLLSLTGIFK